MPWKECSVVEERLRFCCQAARRRGNDRALPGVRHFTQNRLFDCYKEHGLEALTDPLAPARALRQPAAQPGREPDRQPQARQATLGRP